MGKEWMCLGVRYLGVKVGKRSGGIGNGISLRSSRGKIHVCIYVIQDIDSRGNSPYFTDL